MSTSEPVTALPLPDLPAGPTWTAHLRLWWTGFVSKVVPPLVILALLLGIWELLGQRAGAPLPAPSQVVRETWDLIVHPFFNNGGNDVGLGWQLLASLQRVAYGYALAVLVGVSLGVLIGQSTWALRGLDPIFQILRTVPPLAWLPISLAGFRDSAPSAIFVIFITSIWPIIINTSVGIRNIPEDYRNVARVIQLNGFEYFGKVMLPAAAPYIFSGLRIGVGLSWLAIIAAEMLIGGVGIGFWVWDEWNNLNVAHIIIAIAIIGVVGLLLELALVSLARALTHEQVAN